MTTNATDEQPVPNSASLFSGRAYMSNEAVNAAYDYTSAEIDLLVKIIWRVSKQRKQSQDLAPVNLQFSYAELLPGGGGSDYQELRRAIIGLMRKPIEVYYKETKSYFIGSFLSYAVISPAAGTISVSITPRMAEIFFEIAGQFTGIEIESLLKLRGKYAKRLYILLMQFKATGVRYLSIDQVRKLFRIDDKYDKISDIKKRVIDPAVNEICQMTELQCAYETSKKGRNISEVCFLIKLKEAAAITAGDTRQREYLKQCGVSAWMIENAVHSIDPAELHRILYHVKCNQNTIKNKGAYISAMLAAAGVNTRQKIDWSQSSISL
jgi:plasmid replication initiation protein